MLLCLSNTNMIEWKIHGTSELQPQGVPLSLKEPWIGKYFQKLAGDQEDSTNRLQTNNWVRNYFFPTFSQELINYYCILPIHQRRYPVTPNPPFLYVLCDIKYTEERWIRQKIEKDVSFFYFTLVNEDTYLLKERNHPKKKA